MVLRWTDECLDYWLLVCVFGGYIYVGFVGVVGVGALVCFIV